MRPVPRWLSGSSGVVSGDAVVSGEDTVELATGNISGYVRNSSGTGISNSIIVAEASDDASVKYNTSSDQNGYYEFNLDAKRSWKITGVNPETLTKVTVTTAIQTNSSDAVAVSVIVIS